METPVPKSQIEILNQLIDDEQGTYRIRAGHRVHYVTIPTSTFDEDTMCRPYLLIPQLPAFPDADWTTMCISRGADGLIESTLSYEPLPAIPKPWHHRRIDVLSLKHIKRHRSNVHEVLYGGRPAISKIALFEWDFHRIGNETRVYSTLMKHQDQHPAEPPCAPKFLGHLTENDRVIGFLLEKVEGEFASIDDMPNCKKVLHRLHGMGLIHGDVNRYNFIVDRSNNNVRMIDFEHAEDLDKTKAHRELESLASELAEETGRGGPTVTIQ
ncbi:hypothetical protein M430DRAFT_37085 [Amorphotheca resinae ATCC 22711]|jgi:hypothetical protein|uniref:non-specific serine/threonine protein kinase n=1 Tax=Amorphotheca resinae ATCC 22711 TaxID=857342 RepID=A0A2T3AU00_AMORE|nr:hypothetical protein M430DRAFT_37085 [Amorphotheca resinae ATCC 22711]PSS10957.1 hypothetical protein M430DRAFT_37085 [Amorphotheca resinae ATCC 22711]